MLDIIDKESLIDLRKSGHPRGQGLSIMISPVHASVPSAAGSSHNYTLAFSLTPLCKEPTTGRKGWVCTQNHAGRNWRRFWSFRKYFLPQHPVAYCILARNESVGTRGWCFPLWLHLEWWGCGTRELSRKNKRDLKHTFDSASGWRDHLSRIRKPTQRSFWMASTWVTMDFCIVVLAVFSISTGWSTGTIVYSYPSALLVLRLVTLQHLFLGEKDEQWLKQCFQIPKMKAVRSCPAVLIAPMMGQDRAYYRFEG